MSGCICGAEYTQSNWSQIQPPEATSDFEHFSMSNMGKQSFKTVNYVFLPFKIISSRIKLVNTQE